MKLGRPALPPDVHVQHIREKCTFQIVFKLSLLSATEFQPLLLHSFDSSLGKA